MESYESSNKLKGENGIVVRAVHLMSSQAASGIYFINQPAQNEGQHCAHLAFVHITLYKTEQIHMHFTLGTSFGLIMRQTDVTSVDSSTMMLATGRINA